MYYYSVLFKVKNNLKIGLLTKHSFEGKKSLDFFKRLSSNKNTQSSKFINQSTVSNESHEAKNYI